jgi:hypothetical protein
MGLDVPEQEPRHVFNPPSFTSGNQGLDGEIDKELADVLEEANADADAYDLDVDADIAEALGSIESVAFTGPSAAAPPPPSNPFEEPQLDMELAELLDEPAYPSHTLHPIPSPNIEDKSTLEIHSAAFEALGVGEPPAPPGEGSAVLLSEMDLLPASSGGTLAFASGTTLPLATSALRSTTTPQSLTPGYGSSMPPERPISIAAEDMKHEEVTPALDSLHQQQHEPTEPS